MADKTTLDFSEIIHNEAQLDKYLSLSNQNFKEYIEKLSKARQLFLETGKIDSCIRPIIADSWKRCRKLNLNPYKLFGNTVDQKKFSKVLEENQLLLDSAIPVIENLYDSFKEDFHYLLITDKNGIILYTCGNDYITSLAKRFNYNVGSQWTEELVGTNAISLALRLNRPVKALFSDHYCKSHQLFACNAAVIYDSDNNIMGCINISSYRQSFNRQLQGLVNASALAIQRNIKMQRSINIIDHTFNSISDAILVIDSNLKAEKCNNRFLDLLSITNDQLSTLDIPSLLKDVNFNRLLNNKKPVEITETKMLYKNRSISVYIKISPIIVSGVIDCIVIIVRRVRDIINMSNRFMGNKAVYSFNSILTRNSKMLDLIETAKSISSLNCAVLIEGESGTGKELFAHSIHNASQRSDKPFVAVNCAAIPADLVESELFGYEKGAFTGALSKGKPGKFEISDGGTIFLDEIGELPLEVQSKLLRVLDNHSVIRIGGFEEKKLNVRVIAATNRNLYEEVQNKNFREDLYYRLNVMYLNIPPLRERIEDMELLINYFVSNLNKSGNKFVDMISQDFLLTLKKNIWKGNIRELQNIISRAFYLCKGATLSTNCLPEYIFHNRIQKMYIESNLDLRPIKSKEETEKELIIKAIISTNGKIIKAAKKINMPKTTIYRKIKKYNIDVDDILIKF